MAEDGRESETLTKETKVEVHDDVESRIKASMAARATHIRAQADTLTFEGVRRLLEMDLGLEKYALDGQKSFVKRCLAEYLEGANEGSKKAGDAGGKNSSLEEDEAAAESHKELTSKDYVKSCNSKDEMEGSPVMGLLTGCKVKKSTVVGTEGKESKELKESTIKEAMRKRASYIKANLEKITLGELRRLLEKDLGVDKFALDPCKKFISQQLDEILEASEPDIEAEKKNVKKVSQSKAPKRVSSEASSGSSDSESEEVGEDEEPKTKTSSRPKLQKSEGPGKRKRTANETKASEKKPKQSSATMSEDKSDSGDSGVSDNGQTILASENEKSAKKKEVSTPAYGKRVEHLKSVIKSCGMSIPPSIYKRVKQATENKREACLIKELEAILAKEGLSANPSEKEIKEVKKRKQREKELEGIDMSNIVTTSRRRSASNFVAPPKPKIPIESDTDDAEDTDEGDEDEDEDDNDDEEEEEEEENEEDGGKSQSEDSNDENDEE